MLRASELLNQCLAYVAVRDDAAWLGVASPTNLELLLAGAKMRASLTGVRIPRWRVSGPLDRRDFYQPLVARTGHPSLSIRWPMALELLHFASTDAMQELKSLLEAWADSPDELDDYSDPPSLRTDETLRDLLGQLARRPAMFLRRSSGWGLRCYLAGMDRGGDWLGLPALSGLRDIIDAIEKTSVATYGSPFAGYRVYEHSPAAVLEWAEILPT
jgi:hypothetical protein